MPIYPIDPIHPLVLLITPRISFSIKVNNYAFTLIYYVYILILLVSGTGSRSDTKRLALLREELHYCTTRMEFIKQKNILLLLLILLILKLSFLGRPSEYMIYF